MIPADAPSIEDSLKLENVYFRTPTFARPVDQKFSDQLENYSLQNMLNAIHEPVVEKEPEAPVQFNGTNIPQPSHIVRSDEIVVDHYSHRPESRVAVAAIEAAERALCKGAVTDRFAIIHGLAEGIPEDCFPDRKNSDPTFYLVDKDAMEMGLPSCLLQVWVDKANDCYTPIQFQHPQQHGKLVYEELVKRSTE